MAHKIANVEIEFFHRKDQDGDAILRQHLEEMVASMRTKPLIDHPHYHLLPTRVTNKIDGGSAI